MTVAASEEMAYTALASLLCFHDVFIYIAKLINYCHSGSLK